MTASAIIGPSGFLLEALARNHGAGYGNPTKQKAPPE